MTLCQWQSPDRLVILSKLDLCVPTLTTNQQPRTDWPRRPPPPSSASATWPAGKGSGDEGRGRSCDCWWRKHGWRRQWWWQRQWQRQRWWVHRQEQSTINKKLAPSFRVVPCWGWMSDTCLPFFQNAYDDVAGKEPRLWNCPSSSCHGAFLDTTNSLKPSNVKEPPLEGY